MPKRVFEFHIFFQCLWVWHVFPHLLGMGSLAQLEISGNLPWYLQTLWKLLSCKGNRVYWLRSPQELPDGWVFWSTQNGTDWNTVSFPHQPPHSLSLRASLLKRVPRLEMSNSFQDSFPRGCQGISVAFKDPREEAYRQGCVPQPGNLHSYSCPTMGPPQYISLSPRSSPKGKTAGAEHPLEYKASQVW